MYILNMKDLVDNSTKRNQVLDFLRKHKIYNLNDEVSRNLSFIYHNDEVLATLSYELYCNIALVRCFIFSKKIECNDTKKLFRNISISLKEKKCNYLMSFCDELEEDVFLSLGFKHIDESKVYIEEENFLDSKYKNKKTYVLAL